MRVVPHNTSGTITDPMHQATNRDPFSIDSVLQAEIAIRTRFIAKVVVLVSIWAAVSSFVALAAVLRMAGIL